MVARTESMTRTKRADVPAVSGGPGPKDGDGKPSATKRSDAPQADPAKAKGTEHGRSRKLDWHNAVEAIVFLIGLAIFLYPLIAAYVNYTTQDRAVDDYDMIVAKLSKKQQERVWRDAKQYDVELGRPHLRDPFSTRSLHAPLDRYWKTLDVDGHGMMAYVDIPKIHVKLPVYHGTSDSVLMKGAGHIATTHLPTDNRTIHSIITGHTGTRAHGPADPRRAHRRHRQPRPCRRHGPGDGRGRPRTRYGRRGGADLRRPGGDARPDRHTRPGSRRRHTGHAGGAGHHRRDVTDTTETGGPGRRRNTPAPPASPVCD